MVATILPFTLDAAEVCKKSNTLVGPINLVFEADGLTAVMGPNGSGKTTLLRLIHGLEHPNQGSIHWNADAETVRAKQSFVFQAPRLLRRSVLENLIYPLRLRGVRRAQAIITAGEWLDRIELSDSTSLDAGFLSAGEKQKLALARALICKPELLLLDELTSNLDGRATREIEKLLLEALNDGVRIIMATHNTGQARRLARDVLFLLHGKVHEHSPAETFFDMPRTAVASAYLLGEIVE